MKSTDKEGPLKVFPLRNIPRKLNDKIEKKATETGRSKRVVILDACEKYLE